MKGREVAKIIRVAIYIRVSTLDQAREGYSLEAQESSLRKWCADKGWDVVGLYADKGISGKDINHRPDMRRLIQDAEAGMFDMVVFWALSRFTRSAGDLYKTMDKFDKCGVSMTSYTEAFDTSSPMGRAMVGIMGVFAQMEREITAERVRAAMEVRASKGLLNLSYMLGYDRVGQTLSINEKEAEYVRYAYEQYIVHKNLTEVAQLCNLRGYKGKRGKRPTAYTVYVILTRVRYCGYNTYHGEICPGRYPAIISEDIFNRVQTILNKQGQVYGRQKVHAIPKLPLQKEPGTS